MSIIESVSIDCNIFGFEGNELQILLIKRNTEPSKSMWALPGGFIQTKENLKDAAKRILEEMTGAKNIYMEQVYTFGDVNRYPLRRVITITYYALVKPGNYELNPGPDASEAKWFSIKEIPSLPFDHKKIFTYSLEHLQLKVQREPIGFELLPKKFSLTELQMLYEAILDKQLDKRNFRKKFLKMGLLVKLSEKQKGVAHRAATLYKFDPNIYEAMKKKGFNFDI
jgi:8-oxo-dGTP diphosphatase